MNREEEFRNDKNNITAEANGKRTQQTPPAKQIWNEAKGRLRSILGGSDYIKWIANLRIIAEVNGDVMIAAKTKYDHDRVVADHQRTIQRAWTACDPKQRKIRLICWAFAENDLKDIVADPWADEVVSLASPTPVEAGTVQKTEEPTQVFDTLVVGQSNRIAYSLANRIAQGEPLGTRLAFIYGLQGTGKTHILQALRNASEAAQPDRTIVYLTSEEFLASYQEGVKAKDTRELKRRLRSADILLIDDLHRIACKKKTEIELFENIREVTNNGGLVVLVADEAPGNISGFSTKMQSELKGATVVEVAPPCQAMRMEILRRLSDHIVKSSPNFVMTDAMLSAIEARIHGPGRELCGTIWSLFTEANFGQDAPTDDMLDRVIRRSEGDRKPPSIDMIKRAAMQVFNLSKAEITSTRKSQNIVYPRQIAMYLCRKMTDKSYPQIAHSFNKKDHTTVLYAFNKIKHLLAKDPTMARDVEAVTRAVYEIQAQTRTIVHS